MAPPTPDPLKTITNLWTHLHLPPAALQSLHLPQPTNPIVPSSFRIAHLAQTSIALSALTASLIHSSRNLLSPSRTPPVTVSPEHACVEFKSERLYTLDGVPATMDKSVLAGLFRVKDGYVRVHEAFKHHRRNALGVLGLEEGVERGEVEEKMRLWGKLELEEKALREGAVIAALRGVEEWDGTEQGRAVGVMPVVIRKICDGEKGWKGRLGGGRDGCLSGVRVLEMTRVIAAPVAGRTLAAHGADMLWVTSPKLEDQPILDRDTGRGKRSCRLDIDEENDRNVLDDLLAEADVFLQSYRGGSFQKRDLGAEEVARRSKNGIVVANLSAYGNEGPWKENRGFDSMVQTCSGINVAEAEAYGAGETSRVLPCQALDHASGYFLAAGIMAALYRQAIEGGSYEVQVSLAGTMKSLKSLGQFEGKSGFECEDFNTQREVPEEFLETRESAFGALKAVKHSASVEGVKVGWDRMPTQLGSDDPVWL